MDTSLNTSSIHSIGTAVPPFKISQELHHNILESANGIGRADRLLLRKIYHNSGIDSRHSVLEEFGKDDHTDNLIFHPAGKSDHVNVSKRMELFDSFATDLGEEAIRNCLLQSSIQLKEITHIITFSCTGMSAPGIDIKFVERLGLDRSVERTCINFMGCYAGINALRVANYIVTASPDAVVLICGVELCTLHYQKSVTNDQVIANALFSDGAAATIVASSKRSIKEAKRSLLIDKFYSEFEPSGIDDMAWRIGENGFDIRLSTYVPDLIEKNISALLEKLFLKASITSNDIDWYAIHPGGIKILQACEKALKIPESANENSYKVLKEFGNMSSVTIMFVLKKFLDDMTNDDNGKKMLTCAFGPGLTMESMILTAVCD